MPEDKLNLRNRAMLLILDGFGVNPSKTNNAILHADTPHLDRYFSKYPHTILEASGEAVGLPPGQMGNSEVGHMTIGCGTIIRQDLIRINDAIADGSFFEMSPLLRALDNAKKKEGHIHLIGLVSDGGVHSHIDHLIALINLSNEVQVKPYIHMISDGRDCPPKNAAKVYSTTVPTADRSKRRNHYRNGALLCDGSRSKMGAHKKGLGGISKSKRRKSQKPNGCH